MHAKIKLFVSLSNISPVGWAKPYLAHRYCINDGHEKTVPILRLLGSLVGWVEERNPSFFFQLTLLFLIHILP